MAINNTYVLEVDLKRQMTGRTPAFRRGDNGILIFKLFDDGIEYNIDSVNKAEIYHKTSQGNIIKSNCDFINFEGQRVIRYIYEEKAMMEVGRNETLLVVYENDIAISIQPFPVVIYSDFKGGANSFVELINALNDQINKLILDLNGIIKQSEKGKPNGVASLDATGKIPVSQLPPQLEAYIEHISHTVWEHQVHGLRINDDGIMQYFDPANNTWQNIGFAPTAVGGGTPTPQLLDATITKSNSVVTVTYSGIPTVAIQKWAVGDRDKNYFASNGNAFTGLTFPIAQLGIHTLYYKDSNGMEYVKTFNVAVSDLTAPNITVSVTDGDVTVNISGSVSIKKWAKGRQSISYFQSQGTVFTGNTFRVTEVGWYTIYYKTTAGVEYTREFEVTSSMLTDTTIITSVNETTVTVSNTMNYPVQISKWASGTRTISYFQSSGTIFTGRSFNIPSAGTYTVYFKFTNGIEKVHVFTVSNVDNTPPTISISPNGSSTQNASYNVRVNATDLSGIRTIQYAWSMSTATPTSWTTVSNGGNATLSNVSGNYYLHVKAEDNNGNIANFVSNQFRIDNSTATITVSPNGNSNYSTSHRATVTASGSVSSVQYVVNSSTSTPSSGWSSISNGGSVTVNPSSTGTYYIHVKTTSATGVVTTYRSNAFNIDKTNPTISLSPNGNSTASEGQSTIISVSDTHSGISTIQYAWTTSTSTPSSGWSSTSNNSTVTYNGTATGNVYLHVKATDIAGNVYTTRSNAFNVKALEFTYTVSSGKATITGYKGTNPNVTIPSSINGYPVVAIGKDAFYWSNSSGKHLNGNATRITGLTIPSSVTSIGEGAFTSQQINNIVIPSSVTTIGKFAFDQNHASSITLNEGLKTIGQQSLSLNMVTTLSIPSTVTSIGDYAFEGSSYLSTATFLTRNATFGANIFRNSGSGFVIKGYNSSTIKTYANNNGYTFQTI